MGNGIYRLGWGVAAVFALLFAASMSGIVQGGALDPPGPPGSTMKTLDDLPPVWNRTLSATGGCTSERFDCVLLGDVGVLDRETGLVWERAPSGSPMNWFSALIGCQGVSTGGRYGWRLPTVEELRSLADAQVAQLPAGGVGMFSLVGDNFWTATTNPIVKSRAYIISRITPGPFSVAQKFDATNYRWCVRGVGAGTNGAYEEAAEPTGWGSNLDAASLIGPDSCTSQRFTCDASTMSVLDRETGLVWERAPLNNGTGTWVQAQRYCINLFKANRFGWRLPTAVEMTSLFDLSLDHMPDGHPFLLFENALTTPFWTATTNPFVSTEALIVTPSLMSLGSSTGARDKTNTANSWCVRGGQGIEGQ